MVNQCIYTEIFWVKIELSYHFGCGTRRFQFSRSKKLAFFATQLTSSHLELSFACLVCLERSHKISGYELNNENPSILERGISRSQGRICKSENQPVVQIIFKYMTIKNYFLAFLVDFWPKTIFTGSQSNFIKGNHSTLGTINNQWFVHGYTQHK